MPAPIPITNRAAPLASAAATEAIVNALVVQDPTRQRQPLQPARPRAPIPAALGLAPFGDTIATS